MTSDQKALARIFFMLKVHQSNVFSFEHLFGQVMDYRPTFLKIKPYGHQGDRGNDGYEKDYGRYYQVYAPENPTNSYKDAIYKVNTDFKDKLLPYWSNICEIKEYFFVFNDKYSGSNIVLENTLSAIKNNHSLHQANVFIAKYLEQEFMMLDDDKIIVILNGLPNIDAAESLYYSVLSEVIKHVQSIPLTLNTKGALVAPDLDNKILFNGLNIVSSWLKAKQLETWQLDEYFQNNSDFAKDTLRNHLAEIYQESCTVHPELAGQNNVDLGDLRFVYILNKIAPPTPDRTHHKCRQEAALVIMARYFETCDIFEEPI